MAFAQLIKQREVTQSKELCWIKIPTNRKNYIEGLVQNYQEEFRKWKINRASQAQI